MPNAKLGAKVDRYSFLVRILHSLLHTGLARRTKIAISLIDPTERGFECYRLLTSASPVSVMFNRRSTWQVLLSAPAPALLPSARPSACSFRCPTLPTTAG